MTSLDALLARVLAEDGWDVQRGPVDDSLLLESRDERVLVSWSRGTRDPDADPQGTDAELLSSSSAPAATEPEPAATEPQTADATPSEAPAGAEGGSDIIDASVPPEGEGEEDEAIEEVPTEPKPAVDTGTGSGAAPMVKVRVDEAEVTKEMQPKLLKVQETVLELVPHLAFEYACDLPDGRGGTRTHTGTLLLNAVNEEVVSLEAPRFSDGAPEGARLLDGDLGQETAEKRARKHLKTALTRDIEVENDDGNVSIMETRRVTPDLDEIRLDPQGTWYLPVWRLEGQNGTIRVDAHSGDVLGETLQKVTGTDAEWV